MCVCLCVSACLWVCVVNLFMMNSILKYHNIFMFFFSEME